METKEKRELKKSYDGPGELMGMGSFQFDLLHSINIQSEIQRNGWGVPTGVDYEISTVFGAIKQPKGAQILKVASGNIESLSYDRHYGLNLYFIPSENKFTIEFYEKKEK